MTTDAASHSNRSAGSSSNLVLTFVLGRETYSVDALRVREVRDWSPVTKLAHTPANVLGVLNLRGATIPILDLRMKFDLEHVEYSRLTVVMVLSVKTHIGERDVGVVVDDVLEIVNVKSAEVRPVEVESTPDLVSIPATEHIRGVMPVAERRVILLDIDRLIANEVSALAQLGELVA